MESWDDDNFEPATITNKAAPSNKWEGEDEDDDVKDNWEDEDEENAKEEENQVKVDEVKKKKKPLAERIAEKERQKREELERKRQELEEDDISPEEKLRMQKESDLNLALETTFGDGAKESGGINGLSLPSTKEEFDEFTESLSKKLLPLGKSVEYPNFAENLIRNLCATMSSLDIKKIKNTLDNLYLEKQKIEKGDKPKKKGKGKVKLKMEGDNELTTAYGGEFEGGYDYYEDFM